MTAASTESRLRRLTRASGDTALIACYDDNALCLEMPIGDEVYCAVAETLTECIAAAERELAAWFKANPCEYSRLGLRVLAGEE